MKTERIDEQAEHLTNHIAASGFGLKMKSEPCLFPEEIQSAFVQLMKTADRQDGGFGGAQSFPKHFPSVSYFSIISIPATP
jgi:uncharacterized protein YyaL (SSP411 family)